jgi:hypothetical protein
VSSRRKAFDEGKYGLLTASGEKISIKHDSSNSVKRYTKEELKQSSARSVTSIKKEIPKKLKLSEEELERKRMEMMDNAAWREKDRKQHVKKYYEKEEMEKIEHEKEFDKDFMSRNIKHAQNNVQSLESRIRSNLNNIQRNDRSMNDNFARK